MEAAKLLNYGFANYSLYVDDHTDVTLEPVRVTKGKSDYVFGDIKDKFSFLCSKGMDPNNIRKEISMFEKVSAPVAAGDKIGEIVYYFGNEKIGSIDILAKQDVDKAGYTDNFIKDIRKFFLAYR